MRLKSGSFLETEGVGYGMVVSVGIPGVASFPSLLSFTALDISHKRRNDSQNNEEDTKHARSQGT